MGFQLRPYQQMAVDHAVDFLRRGIGRCMYVAPTGSGKTVIQLAIFRAMPGGLIVSPTDDILRGYAEKLGVEASKRELEEMGFYTPLRLRNRLLRAEIQPPSYLIVDETHHSDAATYKLIDELCDNIPVIGFTATPYRGTSKSTAEFRRRWCEIVTVITMAECVREGYTSFPDCTIIPLMDDDVIEVRNGEFVVEQIDYQCENILGRLMGELDRLYGGENTPDRPTMLCLPSVRSANIVAEAMRRSGFPVEVVTGETKDRADKFRRVVACEATLLQINVVGEGVDLPLRRCVDVSPTMSPVRFVQGRIGRITRPVKEGEAPPEYICTNRNLLRHAYLLEGLLPPDVYIKGSKLFNPSDRRNVRVLGFEGLGRFASVDIPLHGGATGTMVAINAVENGEVTEYAAIASPLHANVLYAERKNYRKPNGTVYGRWRQIEYLPDIKEGFASIPARPLTEKQMAWWQRAARFYGLDASAVPNSRQFAALPILKDTNFRFR